MDKIGWIKFVQPPAVENKVEIFDFVPLGLEIGLLCATSSGLAVLGANEIREGKENSKVKGMIALGGSATGFLYAAKVLNLSNNGGLKIALFQCALLGCFFALDHFNSNPNTTSSPNKPSNHQNNQTHSESKGILKKNVTIVNPSTPENKNPTSNETPKPSPSTPSTPQNSSSSKPSPFSTPNSATSTTSTATPDSDFVARQFGNLDDNPPTKVLNFAEEKK